MAKILSILRKQITDQRLYNLAVQDDESYIANGIIVHNCKSYISPNLTGKKNPPLTEGGLKPSKSSLDKYVTLSEQFKVDGFMVQSIIVSKMIAKTSDEAKLFVRDYGIDTPSMEESELGYKFVARDMSLFGEDTLKSFSPLAGVTIFVGLLKPTVDHTTLLTMGAHKFMVQSMIVSKDLAKMSDEAKSIARNYGIESSRMEENETGYKFIVKDIGLFNDGSLKNFSPIDGVIIFMGLIKPLDPA